MYVSLIIYVCLPCWISSNVVVFILENLLITLFVNYSLQHHYRDFHISDIVTALANCSRIPLNVKKKYTGDVEEEETSNPLTERLALEAVKSRANGGGKGRQSPTIQL